MASASVRCCCCCCCWCPRRNVKTVRADDGYDDCDRAAFRCAGDGQASTIERADRTAARDFRRARPVTHAADGARAAVRRPDNGWVCRGGGAAYRHGTVFEPRNTDHSSLNSKKKIRQPTLGKNYYYYYFIVCLDVVVLFDRRCAAREEKRKSKTTSETRN